MDTFMQHFNSWRPKYPDSNLICLNSWFSLHKPSNSLKKPGRRGVILVVTTGLLFGYFIYSFVPLLHRE